MWTPLTPTQTLSLTWSPTEVSSFCFPEAECWTKQKLHPVLGFLQDPLLLQTCSRNADKVQMLNFCTSSVASSKATAKAASQLWTSVSRFVPGGKALVQQAGTPRLKSILAHRSLPTSGFDQHSPGTLLSTVNSTFTWAEGRWDEWEWLKMHPVQWLLQFIRVIYHFILCSVTALITERAIHVGLLLFLKRGGGGIFNEQWSFMNWTAHYASHLIEISHKNDRSSVEELETQSQAHHIIHPMYERQETGSGRCCTMTEKARPPSTNRI